MLKFQRISCLRSAFVVLAMTCLGRAGWSCATVESDPGERTHTISGGWNVETRGEMAVIVWDQEKHREYFVRAAEFNSKGKAFGFLVPTPDVPTLTEVDGEATEQLSWETEPRIEVQSTRTFYFTTFIGEIFGTRLQSTFNNASTAIAGGDEVQVLQLSKLGDYDVAVLRSSNANALGDWLKHNGFVQDAPLRTWLRNYVGGKWAITAFKVRPNVDLSTATLPAICMSFNADQPFYPYREPARPAKPHPNPRALHVFLLSADRMTGRVGQAPGAGAWPGVVAYSNTMSEAAIQSVGSELRLPQDLLRRASRLTIFVDNSSPRPVLPDVKFDRDEDQATLTPLPIIKWIDGGFPVYLDLWFIAGCGIMGLVVKISRWLVGKQNAPRTK